MDITVRPRRSIRRYGLYRERVRASIFYESIRDFIRETTQADGIRGFANSDHRYRYQVLEGAVVGKNHKISEDVLAGSWERLVQPRAEVLRCLRRDEIETLHESHQSSYAGSYLFQHFTSFSGGID